VTLGFTACHVRGSLCHGYKPCKPSADQFKIYQPEQFEGCRCQHHELCQQTIVVSKAYQPG